jgi:photosystem II stability/assembly factor-like uncharacterized protein
MNTSKIRLFGIIFICVVSFGFAGTDEAALDSSCFGGTRARMIGPAIMSGRVTNIQGVNRDPRILYIATASGGIWKSVNGGVTCQQVFRDYTMSVETIAIDQNNPDTVWAGTGECNVRNSVSLGTGLYKTTNGGKTWEFVYFKDSERISKIVIHPGNSNIVYVGVMGHLWDANPERGVYKTSDNGKTWERVLFIDDSTGCADLEMDPQEPETLYAAMWEFRRTPYSFNSGGKGSGLFKSSDAGKNWKKLTKGLPTGNLGRIAIAVAPSRPGTLYATVEAKETALYRSDVMGEDWEKVNDTISVTMRPFYFSQLIVDPLDHQRIYVAGLFVSSSDNGGKSFNFGFFGSVHSDIHALWVNPGDPNQLFVGTDGGVYVSQDRGQHFDMVACLPISQFYHVHYDMKKPYNVYGGLQDNGSWYGPAKTYSFFGIQNKDWHNVGGGDGFYVYPHPQDPNIVYFEYQGGHISRVDQIAHESKDIQPLPARSGEPEYRFNWNAAVALSPAKPDRIYIGAQFLFRSNDRGDTWDKVSPDLTTNDPRKLQQDKSGGLTIDNTTAENYCTIYAIAESPLDENTVWVGTDDGNLQVSRDGGKSWKNTVKNIPGLPANTWCSSVEPSRFDSGTVYATFDGHRTGDMKSYVYKSTDTGLSWTSLNPEAVEGYCHIIREDNVNKNLLFLGTEFGLHVSIDGGKNWAHLTEALPRVPVMDIKIHPRDNDLILATHGLGIQIIDDITPLRFLTAEVLNTEAAVLPSRKVKMETPTLNQEFPPDSEFAGENPSEGAAITYYLKKRHIFGPLKLEILDAAGNVIQTLPTSKRRGLNRIHWGMRLKPPKAAGAPGLSMFVFTGPMVDEGTYTARLVKGKQEFLGKIELVVDEDTRHSEQDRKLQKETVMKLYRMQEELGYVANSAADLSDQIKKRLPETGNRGVRKNLADFRAKLDRFQDEIVQRSGIMAGDKLREKIMGLYSSVIQYGGRPTDAQLFYLSVLEGQIKKAEATFKQLVEKNLAAVNAMLKNKKLTELKVLSREAYNEKE